MKESQVDIEWFMRTMQQAKTLDELERLLTAHFPDFSENQLIRLMLKAMWLGGNAGFEALYAVDSIDPKLNIDDWIAAQLPRPWEVEGYERGAQDAQTKDKQDGQATGTQAVEPCDEAIKLEAV